MTMTEPSGYYSAEVPARQPTTQNLPKSRVPDRPEGAPQTFREGPREAPRYEAPRYEAPRPYRSPPYPMYPRPNIPARSGSVGSFGTVAAIAILALIAVFMFMKLSG